MRIALSAATFLALALPLSAEPIHIAIRMIVSALINPYDSLSSPAGAGAGAASCSASSTTCAAIGATPSTGWARGRFSR